jgi:hypothetical protein
MVAQAAAASGAAAAPDVVWKERWWDSLQVSIISSSSSVKGCGMFVHNRGSITGSMAGGLCICAQAGVGCASQAPLQLSMWSSVHVLWACVAKGVLLCWSLI